MAGPAPGHEYRSQDAHALLARRLELGVLLDAGRERRPCPRCSARASPRSRSCARRRRTSSAPPSRMEPAGPLPAAPPPREAGRDRRSRPPEPSFEPQALNALANFELPPANPPATLRRRRRTRRRREAAGATSCRSAVPRSCGVPLPSRPAGSRRPARRQGHAVLLEACRERGRGWRCRGRSVALAFVLVVFLLVSLALEPHAATPTAAASATSIHRAALDARFEFHGFSRSFRFEVMCGRRPLSRRRRAS